VIPKSYLKRQQAESTTNLLSYGIARYL
jgi:hypothetical protein